MVNFNPIGNKGKGKWGERKVNCRGKEVVCLSLVEYNVYKLSLSLDTSK